MEEILRKYTESINNLIFQVHHLFKKHQILPLNKLNSATLYEILIEANKIKPTSQTYFENLFSIFTLIGKAAIGASDIGYKPHNVSV